MWRRKREPESRKDKTVREWHAELEAEAVENRHRYLPSAMASARRPQDMSCEEFRQFREDSVRKLEGAARQYSQPPERQPARDTPTKYNGMRMYNGQKSNSTVHAVAFSLNGRQPATSDDKYGG